MEAKLDQEIEKNTILPNKNGLKLLWMFIKKPFDNLSKLEIVVFFLNTVLLMVMFGAGISTMIHEATNFFPIHPLLMYPIGFILMGIVVMATHIVTKLSAELVFELKRYNLHYKILLPITNVALIILCWSVQSEGGEIMSTGDIEAQIAIIKADTTSSSLKQVDSSIKQLNVQLGSVTGNIASYQALQKKRKGSWLSEDETKLFLASQSSQQQLSQQLMTMTTSRIAELNTIRENNAVKIASLKQELESEIQKGRSKAGLAECLLVFISFFMMAYKNRFKSYKVEDLPTLKEFPSKLSIDEREEMKPHIKSLGYDDEAKHLHIEHIKEQFYFDIPKFMHAARGNRREYDLAVEKGKVKTRNTKLRNLEFYEFIMALTKLEIEHFESEYSYTPMYPDYWKGTTRSTSDVTSEVHKKDLIVLRSA